MIGLTGKIQESLGSSPDDPPLDNWQRPQPRHESIPRLLRRRQVRRQWRLETHGTRKEGEVEQYVTNHVASFRIDGKDKVSSDGGVPCFSVRDCAHGGKKIEEVLTAREYRSAMTR